MSNQSATLKDNRQIVSQYRRFGYFENGSSYPNKNGKTFFYVLKNKKKKEKICFFLSAETFL